jgi:hypothetical protein
MLKDHHAIVHGQLERAHRVFLRILLPTFRVGEHLHLDVLRDFIADLCMPADGC